MAVWEVNSMTLIHVDGAICPVALRAALCQELYKLGEAWDTIFQVLKSHNFFCEFLVGLIPGWFNKIISDCYSLSPMISPFSLPLTILSSSPRVLHFIICQWDVGPDLPQLIQSHFQP